ncbi:MAG: hypothetical protein Ct9H300mP8_04460 [Gammaproteobacteria bacterium]|nr:MAG: hypothetical protein Ct9H300mP8_04460 [Gammaproteobacteria bacterium]
MVPGSHLTNELSMPDDDAKIIPEQYPYWRDRETLYFSIGGCGIRRVVISRPLREKCSFSVQLSLVETEGRYDG